ncbi:MAG: methyltransferase domain-containing protein [Actinomycetota bacterium]
MKECSKAVMRRLRSPEFATRWFVGQGLDIGGAADPLGQFRELFPQVRAVRGWDAADGDAQYLAGVPDASFDFVHALHALATTADPSEALKHWFRVLKPGGHLVVVVPDEDMYAQGAFPPRYNTDHRWTFTVYKAKSWSPRSLNLVELLQGLGAQAEIKKIEVLDQGFRHGLPAFDQTLTPVAECGVEVVVRKRPLEEAVAGGRLPKAGRLSAKDVFVLTGLKVEEAKG